MRKQIPLIKKAGAFALSLGLMFTLVLPYAIYAEEEGTVTPQTEETNTQEQVKEKENNAELSNIKSIDVTKPVIEDINFEAGKTFEVGEEVPISIKAYDAESGIDFVKINIYYTQSDDDNYYNGSEITLVYNEVTKLYEGKIPVINGGYDKALINRIYAVDKNHNLTEIYESEKYYFLISGGENNNLKHSKVESLEFKENRQTLTDKDQVHISITVPEEDSKYFSSINLEFYNKEKERYSSLSCHKVGDSNVYESYDSLLYFYGGHWVLNEIYAHDEERIDISYDKMDTIFFDYKGDKDEENPKIESIVMDKQGEFVKPGDDIQIHIKVSDNVALRTQEDTFLLFQAEASIYPSQHRVDLKYDENKDEFIGHWLIDSKTYPCEWYIDYLGIWDTSGNSVALYDFIGDYNPYYIKVNNDNNYVTPTYSLNISFYALDENGDYFRVSRQELNDIERHTKFKDMDIKMPDGSTSFENLKFVKWVDDDNNPYNGEKEMLGDFYINFFAVYDKNVINFSTTYVNKDEDISWQSETITVPTDMTYQELFDKYEPNVDDLYTGKQFDKWVYSGFDPNIDLNEEIPFQPWNYSIQAYAKFKDLNVIQGSYTYINVDGETTWQTNTEFVKETLLRSEAFDSLSKYEVNSYEGLRFAKWVPTGESADNTMDRAVFNYESFEYDADYENHLVRFVLYDRNKPYSSIGPGGGTTGFEIGVDYITVADDGEEIKVPEFNMKDIEWYEGPESDVIMVTSNLYYYGIGTGIEEETPDVPDEPDTPVTPDQPDEPDTPEEPEKPDTPDKPVTPVEPEKPITPDKPSEPDKEITDTGTSGSTTDKVIVLPKEETNKIVEEIAKADKEEKIEVFMGNATVVPTEVLEAAKGKDVVVELNMGGYTWEINGKDILASNLKDINLEVKMDSHAVPSNIVKELAGDNPVKQLSLTHNGNFGFKANLKINVGNEYKGKYGNLYYYDSDGKMVYMNAGKIDENGNVVVSFSHASDYVIVINDKNMAPSTNNKDVIKDTANHVNNLYGFVSIILCISGAFMLLYTNKKKSEE